MRRLEIGCRLDYQGYFWLRPHYTRMLPGPLRDRMLREDLMCCLRYRTLLGYWGRMPSIARFANFTYTPVRVTAHKLGGLRWHVTGARIVASGRWDGHLWCNPNEVEPETIALRITPVEDHVRD